MIGLVLVSHSPKIVEGLAHLIREMSDCPLALAGGIDDPDHPIGTDAVKIMQAIEEVMSDDGVIIFVDLGSAILSAQTALDLLDPAIAEKVSISSAPLVEGALSASIIATTGADRLTVLHEAENALNAKKSALGEVFSPTENLEKSALSVTVTVTPKNGLHARPAGRLIATLKNFDATLKLEKDGKLVNGKSLVALLGLGIRQGEALTLHAEGSDAQKALQAFVDLANNHFGDEE